MNKKSTERRVSQSGTFSVIDIEPLLERDHVASRDDKALTRRFTDHAATGVMRIVSENVDESGPRDTDNPKGQA